MILYGSSLSPFVRKVLAFAGEKGITLDLEPTGSAPGHPSDAFLEASPLRKMPALRDRDFTLANSSAIIHYLEALQPDPNLIPADPQARGRTIWFDEFADTVLNACGAKMFFNRVVSAPLHGPRGRRTGRSRRRARRAAAAPRLSRPRGSGVRRVSGRREGITLADISIASEFANLAHMGCVRDSRSPCAGLRLCRPDPRTAELCSVDRARDCFHGQAHGLTKTRRAPRGRGTRRHICCGLRASCPSHRSSRRCLASSVIVGRSAALPSEVRPVESSIWPKRNCWRRRASQPVPPCWT